MTNKSTKKDEPQVEATSKGTQAFGYALGAILGLLILLAMWAFNDETKPAEATELPQLVVMVEFDSLANQQVRADLARLHRELVATGTLVFGPLNYPLLIPGKDGALPEPKDIDALTDEEFRLAQPLMIAGGWFIPRLYNQSLTRAVIRVYPKGARRFPSGLASRVEDILGTFEGTALSKTHVYSQALDMLDPQARAAINLRFGVQTANLTMLAANGHLRKPAILEGTMRASMSIQRPEIRSVVTLGNFIDYAWTVWEGAARHKKKKKDRGGRPPAPGQQGPARFDDPAKVTALLGLAKRCRIPPLVNDQGNRGVILIATAAEGEANLDLCYHIAANLKIDNVNLHVSR